MQPPVTTDPSSAFRYRSTQSAPSIAVGPLDVGTRVRGRVDTKPSPLAFRVPLPLVRTISYRSSGRLAVCGQFGASCTRIVGAPTLGHDVDHDGLLDLRLGEPAVDRQDRLRVLERGERRLADPLDHVGRETFEDLADPGGSWCRRARGLRPSARAEDPRRASGGCWPYVGVLEGAALAETTRASLGGIEPLRDRTPVNGT